MNRRVGPLSRPLAELPPWAIESPPGCTSSVLSPCFPLRYFVIVAYEVCVLLLPTWRDGREGAAGAAGARQVRDIPTLCTYNARVGLSRGLAGGAVSGTEGWP